VEAKLRSAVERSLTHSVYATAALGVTPSWHRFGPDPFHTCDTFVATVGDMDLSALSRGRAIAGALLLIAALFLGGRYLASAGSAREASRPAAAAGELRAEPRPRLVVHVVGAVRRPGLYRLADGARIAEALRRAGGATRRADLSLVNLAAPVSDGSQIVVPKRAPPVAAGSGPAGAEAAPAAGPVHLNTATVEQLDELPGVGPVTAQKIVDYREQHGAFSSVDDLDAIPGIGPARLEQLRDLVAP
jgi:competence protein ComEA